MRRIPDLGRDEGRQGCGDFPGHPKMRHLCGCANLCKEFAGTLLGFDDYVNMVLEDVVEL